jgi:hypothetical protein
MAAEAARWLIFQFERTAQGQVMLAGAPVNKFTNFPIHSLEGAIKYVKCKTSVGIGLLTCVCENQNGSLRVAWTEDKGMER